MILIVEDSDIVTHSISSSLHNLGFTSCVATTPDVALSLYHNDPRPELMILDNHLGFGVITGMDILGYLDNKVPVVMHSTDDALRIAAAQRGVEFVSKTEGINGLMEKIKTMVKSGN